MRRQASVNGEILMQEEVVLKWQFYGNSECWLCQAPRLIPPLNRWAFLSQASWVVPELKKI